MHGLILAPGEPSPGDETPPAPFVEVGGGSLLDHQIDALGRVCDAITVVVGQGFLGSEGPDPASVGRSEVDIRVRQRGLQDPPPEIDRGRIRSHVRSETAVDLTAVVLPHWSDVGTADACRQGLREDRDHTLILDGDVLARPEVIGRVATEYDVRIGESGRSVMGVIPGGDSEVLSVDWNVNGRVTTFGDEAAHGIAGIHVLHRDHVPDLAGLLDQHPAEAYPLFLPAVDTTFLPIPGDGHVRLTEETDRAGLEDTLDLWARTAETPAYNSR